jgi:pimeloyl-ACP methyl ester carboxylesterase
MGHVNTIVLPSPLAYSVKETHRRIVVDGTSKSKIFSPTGSEAIRGAHALLPGVRLWFVDTGGPGTPVILLHANTGTVHAWTPQINALQQAGFRAIAFDRRGWGRSMADPSTGDQPGSVAQDLDALATYLKLPAFHLVGIAGGGFVALDFATWRPERVLKLIVAGSNGQFNEPEMQALSARIAIPGLTGVPESRPLLEVGVAYRAEDPDGFARFIEMEHSAKQPDAPAQPMRTPNTFAKIAAIQASTLIIMGGADLIAPPALMRTWARHIKQAQYVDVPDAGHSINWERPEPFNQLMLDFLNAPET